MSNQAKEEVTLVTFRPGDRVTYEKAERRAGRLVIASYKATYVRFQAVNGRLMHIITLDDRPQQPRQVGSASIRLA